MTTSTIPTLLYKSLRDKVSRSSHLPPTPGGFFHGRGYDPGEMEEYMQFFASAITTLQTLVVALGAGLGVWGVVNLLEGYGSDNPGSKAAVRLPESFP